MKIFWCPICSACPPNNVYCERSWRYEHEQKEHPGYYAVQMGILEWKK